MLIDCPPNFNIVTKTAIVASDKILVPAIPDFLSTLGIEELQRHIDELVNNFNDFARQAGSPHYDHIAPRIMGVVPTMVQIRSGHPIHTQQRYIERIEQTGLPVFDNFIRRNDTVFADAPQYGVPVVLGRSDPRGIRSELEQLTTEFIRRAQ